MVVKNEIARIAVRWLMSAVALCALQSPAALAATLQSPFTTDYTLVELGAPSGLPTPFGGLFILSSDPNTLYIGGQANQSGSGLYCVPLTRDISGKITGFAGSAVRVGDAPYIDGGVQVDPGGKFVSYGEWPVNKYAQINFPGSGCTPSVGHVVNEISLGPLGVASSAAAVAFIPGGYPGAGGMRIASYGGGQFYTVSYSTAHNDIITINSVSQVATLQGGPEGWTYVPLGSAQFANPSMILTEYGAGNVVVYDMDGNGNPVVSSRRVFLSGLTGAEGAAIDPRTGSFLFSTFGAANHVVMVHGFSSPPTASLAPASLTFASRNVGTTSAAQTVTLTNTSSSATLSISSISASGDFAVVSGAVAVLSGLKSTTCGSSLAPSASCTIDVTFTPTASGARTGTLSVVSNATGSPHTVSLSGTGAPTASAAVSLSPGSLSFTARGLGTTSPGQTVTLANAGGASLTISSIGITGDFAKATACPSTLAPSASCTIDVTFSPTALGSRTGSLSVSSNASGSPHAVSLSGIGLAVPTPAIALSLTSLTFTAQAVGTTSPAQSVVVINTGTGDLAIGSIGVSAGFTMTTNCGTVAPSGSCTIEVKFAPTIAGNTTGSVTISSNAAGSPHTISLAGTATAPIATLSPSSLSFGSQAVGTVSTAQRVTLSNTGTAPLAIASIAASASFSQSTTCGAALANGASCTIDVSFAPVVFGPVTGSLTVATNAAGSPHGVALGGTGTGPRLALSPASLAFGSQAVGSTSPLQRVTVSNSGTAPLVVGAISANAPFSASGSCGTLAPSATCAIDVTFAPTAAGPASGSLTVASNAPGSPHAASLSGTGTAPGVGLSPGSLSFGPVAVGVTSPARTVTLTNTGVATLSITGISAGGAFGASSSCPASLAPGGTCSINVTFTPNAAGNFTGSVTVSSNAVGSPHGVALSGTGSAPVIGLSPGSLSFAARTVHTTSPVQTVTVSNTGTAPLAIGSIGIDGDYSFASACPSSLAPNATCTIDVTFTPLVPGTRNGSLSVGSNAAGSPHAVSLSGAGQAVPVAILEVSPSALDFTALGVGLASAPQLVHFRNGGNIKVNIGSPAADGDFALLTGTAAAAATANRQCGGSLLPAETCDMALVFRPTAPGTRRGTLTIPNDGTAPVLSVGLVGTGLVVVPPRALTVPGGLAFGDQRVATRSAAQSLAIANNLASPVAITELSTSGTDFTVSDLCSTIAAHATCSPLVTFQPAAVGARTGSITIRAFGETDPYVVNLTGNGIANPIPALTVSASLFGFGNVLLGSTPNTSIVLVNIGQVPVQLNSISATGDFLVESLCGASIAVGASCSIRVTFLPFVVGGHAGVLTIVSNAEGSPHQVELSGTGCAIPSVSRSRVQSTLCGP